MSENQSQGSSEGTSKPKKPKRRRARFRRVGVKRKGSTHKTDRRHRQTMFEVPVEDRGCSDNSDVTIDVEGDWEVEDAVSAKLGDPDVTIVKPAVENLVSVIECLDNAVVSIDVEGGVQVEEAVPDELSDPDVSIVKPAVENLTKKVRKWKKRRGNVSIPKKKKTSSKPETLLARSEEGDNHGDNEESFYDPQVSDTIFDNAPLQSSECYIEDDPSSSPPMSVSRYTVPVEEEQESQNDLCETDNTTILSLMYDKLKEIFKAHKTSWILDQPQGAVRMFKVNNNVNAAMTRCVSWSEGKVRIFVNNLPLPEEQSFVSDVQISSTVALHEMCLSLKNLTLLVDIMTPCTGVVECRNVWDRACECGKGLVEVADMYDSNGCVRSVNCSLLNFGPFSLCESCANLKKYLKRQAQSSQMLEFNNFSKINKRFLSRHNLEIKAKKLQTALKNEKKKVIRLKKRFKKLIEEDGIVTSRDFGEDLMKVLKLHEKGMSETKKVFWKEQIMALSKEKNPTSMRWNPVMIKIALHLQMISGSAYQYLHDSGLVTLPSQRTLYDFTHHVQAKEGIQFNVLKDLKEKMKIMCKTDSDSYFNVMFDEMHIKSDIVISRSTGDVVGYTNLTDVEKELADLENEIGERENQSRRLAKKVLVYMVQGILTNFQEVVGIFSTDELTAPQLYSRTWSLIYFMESFGMKVLSLVCDGASVNKKFFKMNQKLDPSQDFTYSTLNLASGKRDRPLFFIVDPPHLLKTLRNSLANSYSHRNSRQLWKNNQSLSWKAFELLYQVTASEKYKGHKLTKAHIKLTSFSCMKVSYAAQSLSKSVAQSLQKFKNDARFKNLDLDELCEFIELVDRWFNCLNGSIDPKGKRNKKIPDLLPFSNTSDERFIFLQEIFLNYFESWRSDVSKRSGKFNSAFREKMMISGPTIEGLKITIFGFIGAVQFLLKLNNDLKIEAKKFNQDKLEQYFGIIRMSGGAWNNPTVAAMVQKSQSLHIQGTAALPSRKGNTQAKRKSLQVDEAPLPRRRKKQ